MQMQLLNGVERVSAVRRERHARKRAGKQICYICADRYSRHLILSQKLSTLSAYLNSLEDADTVTTSGLFEAMSSSGPRTGGLAKYRWRVVPVPIEDAPSELDRLRKTGCFNKVAILGPEECYSVVS